MAFPYSKYMVTSGAAGELVAAWRVAANAVTPMNPAILMVFSAAGITGKSGLEV
jgi:hypothetical protein